VPCGLPDPHFGSDDDTDAAAGRQHRGAARRGRSERRSARRFCTRRRLDFADAIAESLRTAVLLRRLKLAFRSTWAHKALARENMGSWAHAWTPTPKHSSSSEQIKQGHVPTSCGTPVKGRLSALEDG
jgi:hypothetical protein